MSTRALSPPRVPYVRVGVVGVVGAVGWACGDGSSAHLSTVASFHVLAALCLSRPTVTTDPDQRQSGVGARTERPGGWDGTGGDGMEWDGTG